MELYTDLPAFIDRFSYFGILLCLILGSIGFPFPEEAILLYSGFLIAQRTLSPAPALMVVFAGVLISDMVLYSLGRHYGRRILSHRWLGRIISRERFALIERRFNDYGTLVILIGRQLFGLRAQVLLMTGIMRMPLWRYLISDAIAALVTMGIMITAGYTGGKAFAGIKDMIPPVALVAIIAVAFILIWYAHSRKRPDSRPAGD